MKERPILFTGEMVRAILEGRKTQTRRPVKPQPPSESVLTRMQGGFPDGIRPVFGLHDEPNAFSAKSALGTVGDRLWVRETWALKDSGHDDSPNVIYRADRDSSRMVWIPSIHMPRWASRIDLEITAVRVERVQDITEEDAKCEGLDRITFLGDTFWKLTTPIRRNGGGETIGTPDAKIAFQNLWQSIYGTWGANPWVWVYEFRRVKP